jgi:lysophospholipase L1-like esterase
MAYPNILSRRLNLEFVNLGFSGNGKGEPALARLINQIENKRMIVLDYEANAGETIRETLGPFLDLLREADKEIPILVQSKIRYAEELANPEKLKKSRDRAQFQRQVVETRRSAGDANLYFLDGSLLLGDRADECTVDGVHPTDLGFMMMADHIAPKLIEILKLLQ